MLLDLSTPEHPLKNSNMKAQTI